MVPKTLHSWDRALFMYFLSITNKIQRYTIFFITVSALHVSGGFSAHHQELKNCTHSIRYMSSLLAATASVAEFQLTLLIMRKCDPACWLITVLSHVHCHAGLSSHVKSYQVRKCRYNEINQ